MKFGIDLSNVIESLAQQIETLTAERDALRAFFLPLYKYAHDQNFSDETLGAMCRSTMDRLAIEGIIKGESDE